MDKTSTYTLNNGYEVPVVGFGTIIPDGEQTVSAVKDAIKSGYRLIDTAEIYGNEISVGQGIREAMVENNLKRDDILVSTKAWYTHRGYEKTTAAFNESLRKLGLDYVDIYLIHWPANAKWHDDWRELNADTWRALEDLYKAGKIKAIGVSNFLAHHLKALVEDSTIKPMLNQIEYHPGFAQTEAAEYSQAQDIQVEAWSPFGGPGSDVLKDVTVNKIAKKYGKQPSQVILRWLIQKQIIPLTKSTSIGHMQDNLSDFDFKLTNSELATIDKAPYSGGFQFDPDTAKS
ncbi:aldo/keto reductase [Companilactobacillus huachuanensis]|uniref:Aldo/keto reductase n=1 Tax=Companilactobacillus huachuanensis TaxID=2559914 RepID=A0ABW1RIS3_9LACO|nr:aldo/keto reductase [Companilactobacillus huachuanensis]